MKIFICTSVMFICIISYVDYYFPVVCKDKATFTCKHVGLVLHKDPEENTKHLLIFLIYGKLNYWDFFSLLLQQSCHRKFQCFSWSQQTSVCDSGWFNPRFEFANNYSNYTLTKGKNYFGHPNNHLQDWTKM